MRQYRGKLIEIGQEGDGDWVFGYYCKITGRHFIIPDCADCDHQGEGIYEVEGLLEVIPETVGQSTDWYDIEKTEIYDDDFLDIHPGLSQSFIRQVHWDDEFGRWQALFGDGSGGQLFTKRQCLTYKIIGNTTDNKELLGTKLRGVK